MKKVSSVAAKPSRNISQQKLTVGLDLGDRNCGYRVLDESGQIQREQPVRTNAKALQDVLVALPRSRIALEIGTHSPWISRLLSELGHEVIVANARKVRLIGESRKKDDRLDAQTLARLARIDPELLYPVKHRSAQAQAEFFTKHPIRLRSPFFVFQDLGLALAVLPSESVHSGRMGGAAPLSGHIRRTPSDAIPHKPNVGDIALHR